MAKRVLKPIYKEIYGEDFIPSDFSNRMEMQKAVFLMQESGIMVGDYDFLWYKHGPYSQSLQDDILGLGGECEETIRFSVEAINVMNKLKEILNENVTYSRSQWAECLASVQYLKNNIFSFNTSDDDIIQELQKRKPHLDNRTENLKALDKLRYLFA